MTSPERGRKKEKKKVGCGTSCNPILVLQPKQPVYQARRIQSLLPTMANQAAARLKSLIADPEGKVIVCPGVYDGLTARVALQAGFDVLYMVSCAVFNRTVAAEDSPSFPLTRPG
jgi:hypothetical protein